MGDINAKTKAGRMSPGQGMTMRTPELIQKILDRIIAGESLKSICRDEEMPEFKNVMIWRHEDPELDTRFIRAMATRAGAFEEQILDLIDTTDDISHAQLMTAKINGLKWLANIAKPKRYAENAAQGAESPMPKIDSVEL